MGGRVRNGVKRISIGSTSLLNTSSLIHYKQAYETTDATSKRPSFSGFYP